MKANRTRSRKSPSWLANWLGDEAISELNMNGETRNKTAPHNSGLNVLSERKNDSALLEIFASSSSAPQSPHTRADSGERSDPPVPSPSPSIPDRGIEHSMDVGRSRSLTSRHSFTSLIRSARSSMRRLSIESRTRGSQDTISPSIQASGSFYVHSEDDAETSRSPNGSASTRPWLRQRSAEGDVSRKRTDESVDPQAENRPRSTTTGISSWLRQRHKRASKNPASAEDMLPDCSDVDPHTSPSRFHHLHRQDSSSDDLPESEPSSSRAHNDTISSRMSTQEVISLLNNHQCPDITTELDMDSCSNLAILGGGFGDVYRGQMRTGAQVAIKCARLFVDATEWSQESIKNAARELYAWSKCQHPNIVELLGVAHFRHQIAMISPWMENGTLPQYLVGNPHVDKFDLSIQMARGVAYLHDMVNIVHGDIKGTNVLISELGVAKLTDFGNSVLKHNTLQFSGASLRPSHSLRWAAPEIIIGRERSSKKADVYALGMTILETFTGKVPYQGKSDVTVIYLVTVGEELPERPDGMTNWHWALLRKSWSRDPGERPAAWRFITGFREAAPYLTRRWGLDSISEIT